MLSLLAAFAANRCSLPPPPPLLLLPGRHHLHRHHRGQTFRCPLPKKEATAAHHQHTNGSTKVKTFTSPDDWTYLTYLQYQGNLAITKLVA
jgi:hypothetical protein